MEVAHFSKLFATSGLCLVFAALVLADCQQNLVSYCAGTAQNSTLNSTYVCGDFRLGPVVRPRHPPSEGLFDVVYGRFGGLCPGEFLAAYYSESLGTWLYPPYNGFQLDTTGKPMAAATTLPVGLLIDRFGSEYGSFASPAFAPFMQRALPPSSLDTPTSTPMVIQPMEVLAGPIAPWFGQPGQGVQYYLLNGSILSLLDANILERANVTLLA
ncbi:hypothetical protein SPI_01957 [Niveomyces insectorum RCEF 264]|uniref:TNT domain-containing protein n=1 Tax=Niveomyces insectorum RCEF 264 TaxID=1081102 RepID=A0A162MQ85_9HYPO|nr:hypothetical protein SPI_01957 [Niveomyces insectorum RCEF 264]